MTTILLLYVLVIINIICIFVSLLKYIKNMNKKYYSVLAYAKLKNVTSMTVYNWIKNKKIDYIEFEIGKGNKRGYLIIVDE